MTIGIKLLVLLVDHGQGTEVQLHSLETGNISASYKRSHFTPCPSPQVEGRHGSMVLKTCVGIQKSPDSRVVAVHCPLCTADGFPHLDPRLVTSSI